MTKFFLILSIALMTILPSFSHAQSADQANAQQLVAGSVSTGGTAAEEEQRKKSQGVIDFFAKTVTRSVADQTVKKFANAGLGLNFVMAVFFLFGIGLIIRDTGMGPGAFKEVVMLLIATTLVGSCLNTSIYAGSGLQRLVQPSEGSSGYLDVDFILWAKETMDEAANDIWGENTRDEFEKARVAVFDALVTGKTDEQRLQEQKKENEKMSTVDAISWVATALQAIFVDPVKALLGFAFKLLDILYVCALFLCSVIFSLYLGVSVLLFKIIVVFAVLPNYRQRVVQAFKVPLAFSLFQFTNMVIIFISLVVYQALTAALVAVDATTRGAVMLPLLAFAVFLVAAQIASVFIIPKLSRQLLDLSLEEITNLSGTVMKAVMGLGGAITGLGMGMLTGAAAIRASAGAAAAAGGFSSRDFVNQRRQAAGLSPFQGPATGTGRYPSPYGDGDGGNNSGGGSGAPPTAVGAPPSGGTGGAAPVGSAPSSVKLDGASGLAATLQSGASALKKNKTGNKFAPDQNQASDLAPKDSSSESYAGLKQTLPDIDESSNEQLASGAGVGGSALKKNKLKAEGQPAVDQGDSEDQKQTQADEGPENTTSQANEDADLKARAEQRAAERKAERAKMREERQKKGDTRRLAERIGRRARYEAEVWKHALTNTQFLKTAAKLTALGAIHAVGSTMKIMAGNNDVKSIGTDLKERMLSLGEFAKVDSAKYEKHHNLFADAQDKFFAGQEDFKADREQLPTEVETERK